MFEIKYICTYATVAAGGDCLAAPITSFDDGRLQEGPFAFPSSTSEVERGGGDADVPAHAFPLVVGQSSVFPLSLLSICELVKRDRSSGIWISDFTVQRSLTVTVCLSPRASGSG